MLMERSEGYAEFMRLVHEFVPEVESEIKVQPSIAARLSTFAQAFENRYFPLHPMYADGMGEGYEDITGFIPIVLQSMDFDTYLELAQGDFNAGITLLAYIIENPWQQGEGERLALAEACEQWVSRELLLRVPEEITREDIHLLLDGTQFEPVGVVVDILHMLTGNCFFDEDQES